MLHIKEENLREVLKLALRSKGIWTSEVEDEILKGIKNDTYTFVKAKESKKLHLDSTRWNLKAGDKVLHTNGRAYVVKMYEGDLHLTYRDKNYEIIYWQRLMSFNPDIKWIGKIKWQNVKPLQKWNGKPI